MFSILKELDAQIKGRMILLRSLADGAKEAEDLTWSKPTPVPLVAVRPADEDDICKTVPILARLKRRHGIKFCVKSGGHHYKAYSLVRNGIVLDLSRLNSYKLDGGQSTA